MHGVSVVEVWRQAGGNFVASGNWAVNAGSEAGSFSSVAEQRPKTRPI